MYAIYQKQIAIPPIPKRSRHSEACWKLISAASRAASSKKKYLATTSAQLISQRTKTNWQNAQNAAYISQRTISYTADQCTFFEFVIFFSQSTAPSVSSSSDVIRVSSSSCSCLTIHNFPLLRYWLKIEQN